MKSIIAILLVSWVLVSCEKDSKPKVRTIDAPVSITVSMTDDIPRLKMQTQSVYLCKNYLIDYTLDKAISYRIELHGVDEAVLCENETGPASNTIYLPELQEKSQLFRFVIGDEKVDALLHINRGKAYWEVQVPNSQILLQNN